MAEKVMKLSLPDRTETEVVTVSLNGREVQAIAGMTILEVARGAGIDVPTLCHDPRLEPYGACRMCLVEVEGAPGPMTACGTTIREGMKIETHSDRIIKLRKFLLELLLTNHPLDCPVCEAAGDCRLQDYAYEYQVDAVPWGWRMPPTDAPGAHPNVAHFSSRCILCGRCVRICREVMSIGCWGYTDRGYQSEIDTPYHRSLEEVGCVSCGQCISTCPVGSISGQRAPGGAREWQTDKTVTTCSYCSDGCRLVLHSYRGRVVKVGSETEKGLNGGNLCVKGRFGIGYVNAPDRVTAPMVRNAAGTLEEVSWQSALRLVAEKVAALRQSRGGDALGVISGTHCTNEAAYLLQKLTRTLMGSSNITTLESDAEAAARRALSEAFGSAAATNSRKDIAAADVIVVIGANLTESNPVLALDVIKALRKGKTVIVLDPRTTELARKAKFHLALRPGTDLAALRGMLRHLLDMNLQDAEFVAERTEGFDAFRVSLDAIDVVSEAAECGVDPNLLRTAAAAYGQAGAAVILCGSGLNRGTHSGAAVRAVANLAMLTGNIGRPGTGVIPLHAGANSQGVADMGICPDCLHDCDETELGAIAKLEAACRGQLPSTGPGKTALGMLEAAEKGEMGFLYVMGADPALALADETRTRKALERVEFVVVQDSFVTDTAEYADVILPAAVATEDEGTFTSGERFVQRVRAAAPALGDSLPDWKIVQMVANVMGEDWAYSTAADVMREIADTLSCYKGVSYDRLENESVQVPCPDVDCPGIPILHSGKFMRGRGAFAPVETVTLSTGDPDYPFVLLGGSVLEHHDTGVRSRRSSGLTKLMNEARVEINANDAEYLGVKTDDRVKIIGRTGGVIEAAALVTNRVCEGSVFVPGFSPVTPPTRLMRWRDGGLAVVRLEHGT